MSAQHTNPVFVSDESCTERSLSTLNSPPGNSVKKDVFTIDLKETNKAKEAYDSYDPYLHRKVERPTTNSETLLHLLKGCLGTGILAMPKAFSHSGYLFGSIGTICIGIVCVYCIHLLITAEYELCKRRKTPSLTYPATAEAAFSEGPPFLRKFAPYSV
ncbi:hypothetical protein ILUMI_27203 [Ignelater luminosus]|uniref:Amino acid transporter transmembrane domain-containing protein n=1 Tax=Ignelater luminosus TaxID=2038154 RepID=A0A8K0C3Q2_IGNLU|nr:hypothetical protein ILUMI_27203 [Ignelater luminosus]